MNGILQMINLTIHLTLFIDDGTECRIKFFFFEAQNSRIDDKNEFVI